MAITFETAADLAEFLPEPPDYAPGDAGWLPLETTRLWMDLSETGFEKLRKRIGKKFERKDARGRVWIYFRCWILVRMAVLSEQQQLKGGVRV